MITLLREANTMVERVKPQPGKIKPVYSLSGEQVQRQINNDLAELLSHQILPSAAKVEVIAYLLGELSVSSKQIPQKCCPPYIHSPGNYVIWDRAHFILVRPPSQPPNFPLNR